MDPGNFQKILEMKVRSALHKVDSLQRERKRESVCVCVCERERERERERVSE